MAKESPLRRIDRLGRERRAAHEAEATIDAMRELRDQVDEIDLEDQSMQQSVLDLIDETIEDLKPEELDEPS
jgi:hypothetical protein